MSTEWEPRAASCAEDGALGLFFLALLEALVGAWGAGDEGGLGGTVGTGVFGMGVTAVLPLSSLTVSPLLTPFA
jgi:hypothetical protein